jgi:hypothetical protein
LALARIDLDADHAKVEGRRVGALFVRALPRADFGGGFAPDDAAFSSSEVRSALLAVMALPSVAVVNRATPETWFSFSEWPAWRRRMGQAGVPLAALSTGGGDAPSGAWWLLWGGGIVPVPSREARKAFGAAVFAAEQLRRSLWCYGEIVAGASTPSARLAGRVLARFGINLAEIVTCDDDRFVSCTTHPAVPEQTAGVAERIAVALDGHLRRR